MKKDLIVAVIVAVLLTGISYLVAGAAGWIPDGVNWLEAAAVFTSYACTYLCVRQRRINYPIGAISTAMYCILFVQYGLIASAVLNGYLVFSLIYGWIRWRSDENARPVTHVQPKWWIAYGSVTLAAWGGAMLIVLLLGGVLNPADAVILAGTILAQFLLDNKKIETWFVWAVVNVAAIYVYFSTGLPLAGFQYIFFLANTVYGYIEWRRSMNPPSLDEYDDDGWHTEVL